MNAQQDGVNLNELLRQNINRFETLLNNMQEYANKNNLVEKQRGVTAVTLDYVIYKRSA